MYDVFLYIVSCHGQNVSVVAVGLAVAVLLCCCAATVVAGLV